METVVGQIQIDADLKQIKDGYLVRCGLASCHTLLGVAYPPNRGGARHDDWVMLAPKIRGQSAAVGYSHREEGGRVIYSLIPERWQRDFVSGKILLDHRGQPKPRLGGRAPMRPKNPYGEGSIGLGVSGPKMRGERAPLPALVECPKCRPCPRCPPRLNRVPVPEMS